MCIACPCFQVEIFSVRYDVSIFMIYRNKIVARLYYCISLLINMYKQVDLLTLQLCFQCSGNWIFNMLISFDVKYHQCWISALDVDSVT